MRNIDSELTVIDVVSEMTDEKKECLAFLVGYAIRSRYKKWRTIIKHCYYETLPKCHRKVNDILRELRDSEELVVIFMITKALETKNELKKKLEG